MDEKLTSSMTLYYKSVLPVLWISGFGIGTITHWAGGFDSPEPSMQQTKWGFLLFWIVGSGALLWLAIRLKTVTLSNDHLKITNFTKQLSIPLSSITLVSETYFISPKLVILTLYPGSDFGEKIYFIPKLAFHLPFRGHPVANHIKELTNLQQLAAG